MRMIEDQLILYRSDMFMVYENYSLAFEKYPTIMMMHSKQTNQKTFSNSSKLSMYQ